MGLFKAFRNWLEGIREAKRKREEEHVNKMGYKLHIGWGGLFQDDQIVAVDFPISPEIREMTPTEALKFNIFLSKLAMEPRGTKRIFEYNGKKLKVSFPGYRDE